MLPIGPLMIEHRLIERMVAVMKVELARIEREVKIDHEFISIATDFIRSYADRCHHGKEEGILFLELGKKRLTGEHQKIMDELVEEHRWGRKTTFKLVDADKKYAEGDKAALLAIIECMKSLIEFYPRHIEKEDRQFFLPAMDYFTDQEKATMLKDEYEFDRTLIHEKYRAIVIESEKATTPL